MAAGTVCIRFTSRWPWNVGSLAVARLGGSRDWSHCMIIVRGRVFEATMQHGVREALLSQAMSGVVSFRDMIVPVQDVGAVIEFLSQQVGAKYDYLGALGIPLLYSTDWADTSRWWCSELVFAAIGAGGTWMLDPVARTRVRPVDLELCNYFKLSPNQPAPAGFSL
jgi:hypothetical protein